MRSAASTSTCGAGEVHCIVGPNGAGKSTLIKCIAGVIEPTSGEIRIDGELIAGGNPSAALAQGVATIYQERDLVEDLSVAQNIFLGHELRRWGLLDRSRMRRETTELLRRVNHEGISPDILVRDLRPAGQQIVSIARSLSRDVRLLIMDEPSAILDDTEIETMFGVMRRLAADGVGVVYISHRLDEIRRIGDRVTVLSDGATVASGLPASTPPDELVTRMVGRELASLVPDRASGGAESCSRYEGRPGSPMSRTCRSNSTRARCSVSPAWWAQAGANCCARSTGWTTEMPVRCSWMAIASRRTVQTSRSPQGLDWHPRTGSPRRCCSAGA